MKRVVIYFVVLSFSLLTFPIACSNSEPSSANEETDSTDAQQPEIESVAKAFGKAQLLGHWEVTETWRDGKPVESMDDAFFEFTESNTMTTNILGEAEEHPFELHGDHLHQNAKPHPIDYTIEQGGDSLLVLSMQMRGSSFRFKLLKEQ